MQVSAGAALVPSGSAWSNAVVWDPSSAVSQDDYVPYASSTRLQARQERLKSAGADIPTGGKQRRRAKSARKPRAFAGDGTVAGSRLARRMQRAQPPSQWLLHPTVAARQREARVMEDMHARELVPAEHRAFGSSERRQMNDTIGGPGAEYRNSISPVGGRAEASSPARSGSGSDASPPAAATSGSKLGWRSSYMTSGWHLRRSDGSRSSGDSPTSETSRSGNQRSPRERPARHSSPGTTEARRASHEAAAALRNARVSGGEGYASNAINRRKAGASVLPDSTPPGSGLRTAQRAAARQDTPESAATPPRTGAYLFEERRVSPGSRSSVGSAGTGSRRSRIDGPIRSLGPPQVRRSPTGDVKGAHRRRDGTLEHAQGWYNLNSKRRDGSSRREAAAVRSGRPLTIAEAVGITEDDGLPRRKSRGKSSPTDGRGRNPWRRGGSPDTHAGTASRAPGGGSGSPAGGPGQSGASADAEQGVFADKPAWQTVFAGGSAASPPRGVTLELTTLSARSGAGLSESQVVSREQDVEQDLRSLESGRLQSQPLDGTIAVPASGIAGSGQGRNAAGGEEPATSPASLTRAAAANAALAPPQVAAQDAAREEWSPSPHSPSTPAPPAGESPLDTSESDGGSAPRPRAKIGRTDSERAAAAEAIVAAELASAEAAEEQRRREEVRALARRGLQAELDAVRREVEAKETQLRRVQQEARVSEAELETVLDQAEALRASKAAAAEAVAACEAGTREAAKRLVPGGDLHERVQRARQRRLRLHEQMRELSESDKDADEDRATHIAHRKAQLALTGLAMEKRVLALQQERDMADARRERAEEALEDAAEMRQTASHERDAVELLRASVEALQHGQLPYIIPKMRDVGQRKLNKQRLAVEAAARRLAAERHQLHLVRADVSGAEAAEREQRTLHKRASAELAALRMRLEALQASGVRVRLTGEDTGWDDVDGAAGAESCVAYRVEEAMAELADGSMGARTQAEAAAAAALNSVQARGFGPPFIDPDTAPPTGSQFSGSPASSGAPVGVRMRPRSGSTSPEAGGGGQGADPLAAAVRARLESMGGSARRTPSRGQRGRSGGRASAGRLSPGGAAEGAAVLSPEEVEEQASWVRSKRQQSPHRARGETKQRQLQRKSNWAELLGEADSTGHSIATPPPPAFAEGAGDPGTVHVHTPPPARGGAAAPARARAALRTSSPSVLGSPMDPLAAPSRASAATSAGAPSPLPQPQAGALRAQPSFRMLRATMRPPASTLGRSASGRRLRPRAGSQSSPRASIHPPDAARAAMDWAAFETSARRARSPGPESGRRPASSPGDSSPPDRKPVEGPTRQGRPPSGVQLAARVGPAARAVPRGGWPQASRSAAPQHDQHQHQMQQSSPPGSLARSSRPPPAKPSPSRSKSLGSVARRVSAAAGAPVPLLARGGLQRLPTNSGTSLASALARRSSLSQRSTGSGSSPRSRSSPGRRAAPMPVRSTPPSMARRPSMRSDLSLGGNMIPVKAIMNRGGSRRGKS